MFMYLCFIARSCRSLADKEGKKEGEEEKEKVKDGEKEDRRRGWTKKGRAS